MNRQKKNSAIELLKGEFQSNEAAFIVGMQGMTVAQVESLRKGVRSRGGRFKVAKNSLLRRAAQDLPSVKMLSPYFKNQVAIIFVSKEASHVAKLICDATEENEHLKIVAGCYESRVFDHDMVKYLGSLPSKEVLVAQLCGLLKAPMVQHVSLLNQIIVRLLYVLKQASEKQS
jgi:large subunit ribosomal protein L10